MAIEGLSVPQEATGAGMDTGTAPVDGAPVVSPTESLAPPSSPTVGIIRLREVSDPEGTVDSINSTLSVSARRLEPVEVHLSGDGSKHKVKVTARMLTGSVDAATDDEFRVAQPPKARGRVVEYRSVDEGTTGYTWRRLTGSPGNADGKPEVDPKAVIGANLAERILAPQDSPYGIVVKGDPVPEDTIKTLTVEAKAEVFDVRTEISREVGPSGNGTGHEYAGELQEKLTRYEELRRAQRNGLWNISVVVGGPGGQYEIATEDLAARVEAAANARLPYTFVLDNTPFETAEDALNAGVGIPNASTDVLTHVLPVPVPTRENELPGIPIDKTPELPRNQKNAHKIPEHRKNIIGKIMDGDKPGADCVLDTDQDDMHEVAAGGSGYGKSSFLTERMLLRLQSAHAEGRPLGAMIMNPKPGTDYESLAGELAEMGRELVVVRPGDPESVQVGINFLNRFPGETWDMRNARVLDTILNAASAGAVEPEVLRTVQQYGRETLEGLDKESDRVQSIDERKGRDRYTGKSIYEYGEPSDITPEEFVRGIVKTAASHGYVMEGSNLEKFIGSWYAGLFSGPVREFMSGYPIDLQNLQDHVVLLDLSRVTDPVARSMIMKTSLDAIACTFVEKQRVEGDPEALQYAVTFEEGNAVAPPESPAADALAKRWRDLRSAGVGLSMAVQRISDVDGNVLGNCATRVAFNTGTSEDRKEAASLLGLEDSEAIIMADLKIGEAIVKAPDDIAVRVQLNPPPSRKGQTAELAPASSLVRLDIPETFTKDIRDEAKSFRATTDPGKTITFWAEMAVAAEMLGLGDIAPNRDAPQLKKLPVFDDLQAKTGKDRKIMHCAVRDAVEEAVRTREHIVLRGLAKDPLVERVVTRMRAHIDGTDIPQEAQPGKAHKLYQKVAAKGEHWASITASREAAHTRALAGKNLAQIESELARNPADGVRAQLEQIKTIWEQRAQEADAVLAVHTSWGHVPETDDVYIDKGHERFVKLREIRHPEIADVLIPPRFGGHALNQKLKISVNDAVEHAIRTNNTSSYINALDSNLSMFALSEVQRGTILGEFRDLIERTAKFKREEKARKAAEERPSEVVELMQKVAVLEERVKQLTEKKDAESRDQEVA